MKITSDRSIKIFLELEESEAKWLKGIMQNPMHVANPAQEAADDRMLRERFFNYLTKEI